MLAAHIALLALVGLTPLLVFFDSRLVDSLVELYAAAALALVAFSIRPGEADIGSKPSAGRRAAARSVADHPVTSLPIGAVGSIWQRGPARHFNVVKT